MKSINELILKRNQEGVKLRRGGGARPGSSGRPLAGKKDFRRTGPALRETDHEGFSPKKGEQQYPSNKEK